MKRPETWNFRAAISEALEEARDTENEPRIIKLDKVERRLKMLGFLDADYVEPAISLQELRSGL